MGSDMEPQLNAWGATDVGRRRKHNEDFYVIDADIGLFGVADGVGGHEAGEVASRMVLEGLQKKLHERSDLFTEEQRVGPHSEAYRRSVRRFLDQAVQELSYEVFSLAQQKGGDFRMGTTVCAMIALGDVGAIVHVGDSRCYLWRDQQLYQLTEDHSLVNEQLKMGLITPEEAANSRYKNVITRAVGMADRLQVDVFFVDIVPQDLFLICSDGLYRYLQEGDPEDFFNREDHEKATQSMIEMANQRGGKDNITLIMLHADGEEHEDKKRETEIMAGVAALKHSPLFQHLSYPETLRILSMTTQQIFQPGEVLMQEGDPATHLFIIQEGELAIYRGQELLVFLGSGDYVGEMGIFDDEPCSATAMAQKLTYTVSISGEELKELLRQEPDIGFKIQQNLLRVLIRRLRHTSHALAWTRQEWRRQMPSES